MDDILKVFNTLDELIENNLGTADAEGFLTEAYFAFWRELKKRAGTSSGFTGLSEYLFFKYIQKSLEKEFDIAFEPHQETSETFSLRAGNIILTHDIDISRYIDVKPQKTDITVLVQKGDDYELIAGFQLKIYISYPGALTDDLSKLDDLGQKTNAMLFEILLNPPSKKATVELCQFYERYSGRFGVISKFELGCDIGFSDVIEKISQIL